MATPNDLISRIGSAKRRYKKEMESMIFVLQRQLEAIDHDDFEPSSAVDSGAFNLIQEGNRLKALLDVEK